VIDWTSPIVEFAILLAISVGAHMGVAYLLAPRVAVKRTEAWFASEIGQTVIGSAVDTVVVPRLKEAIPALPDATEIAKTVTTGIEAQLTSKAGVVAKTAQTSLEKIILGLSTGNAYVDGVIAMVPMEAKIVWAKRLATAIRTGGALDNPQGDGTPNSATETGGWIPGTWL
jgi:hypothetical protein